MDCIDESEVLTAADEAHHIDKRSFAIPFVCGAQDLGEALRRIAEGASMIRLKGNAGTGNVMNAVRHARAVFSQIRMLQVTELSLVGTDQLTSLRHSSPDPRTTAIILFWQSDELLLRPLPSSSHPLPSSSHPLPSSSHPRG